MESKVVFYPESAAPCHQHSEDRINYVILPRLQPWPLSSSFRRECVEINKICIESFTGISRDVTSLISLTTSSLLNPLRQVCNGGRRSEDFLWWRTGMRLVGDDVRSYGELKINDDLSLSYHVNKITIDKKKIRIALIFGRFHLLLFSYVRWNNGERKISSCCQRALDWAKMTSSRKTLTLSDNHHSQGKTVRAKVTVVLNVLIMLKGWLTQIKTTLEYKKWSRDYLQVRGKQRKKRQFRENRAFQA